MIKYFEYAQFFNENKVTIQHRMLHVVASTKNFCQ
jgi:hypothetical protein